MCAAGDQGLSTRWRRCLPHAALAFAVLSLGRAQGPSAATPASGPETKGARGYLGVVVELVTDEVRSQTPLEEGEGLLVLAVSAGSPADSAGLQQHDVLVRFDNHVLTGVAQFSALIENAGAGNPATLSILRRGAAQKIAVTLGSIPARPAPALSERVRHAQQLAEINRRLETDHAATQAIHRMLFRDHPAPLPELPAVEGASLSLTDSAGAITITIREGRKWLEIKDASGKSLCEAPCETPADRARLAPEIRARLEKLEQLTRSK